MKRLKFLLGVGLVVGFTYFLVWIAKAEEEADNEINSIKVMVIVEKIYIPPRSGIFSVSPELFYFRLKGKTKSSTWTWRVPVHRERFASKKVGDTLKR